jgi:uncharacterized protein RhaS with RHS repeats
VPVASTLYYYRARFYSPTTGRFISEDPIGLAGGVNLYRYARANPATLTDPTGRIDQRQLDSLLYAGGIAVTNPILAGVFLGIGVREDYSEGNIGGLILDAAGVAGIVAEAPAAALIALSYLGFEANRSLGVELENQVTLSAISSALSVFGIRWCPN